jgi:lysophospholipase L1-like esterase
LLFTIFLGANDAAIIGEHEYVPYPTFSANIRSFIETILTQDNMSDTKIVIITPPPINIPEGMMGEDKEMAIEEANQWKKEGPRHKTYMSKKRYAEGLMSIANEYADTGRVIGIDFWRALVEEKLKEDEEGSWEELENSGMWLGCGLIGAKSFDKGWFTDGLHLDRKGYAVLNRILVESVVGKWPELAPERL